MERDRLYELQSIRHQETFKPQTALKVLVQWITPLDCGQLFLLMSWLQQLFSFLILCLQFNTLFETT